MSFATEFTLLHEIPSFVKIILCPLVITTMNLSMQTDRALTPIGFAIHHFSKVVDPYRCPVLR